MHWYSFALFLFFGLGLSAQEQSYDFWAPAPELNKGRFYTLNGTAAVAYGGTLTLLNKYWYSQFEKSKFHFYNDNGEWNQIDKVGHVWTAYAEGLYGIDLYRWSGLERKKAIWIGGSLGSLFQTTIEILDGFSAKWGASPGDLLANTLGSGLVISQALLWDEQRFKLKFSSRQEDYSSFPIEVQRRAESLYGSGSVERVLKDYNAQTYWLSFAPSAIGLHWERFPRWLNFSVGYGTENLYGGFENVWFEADVIHSYTHLDRTRVFYFTPDVDLSELKSEKIFIQKLLKALNILKLPMPGISVDNSGEFRLYALIW